MNYGSKDKSRLLALILCVSLFAGCNGNSTIGPSNSLWTRCSGLPDLPVTGFASAGNVIVAGSYDALLSQAYIYISFDNGSSWSLDTTFQTDNHGSGTSSYLGTPVTFLSDGLYLFAGVVGGDSGNVYVSMNDGLTWVERDPSFVENIYCLAAMGKTIWAGTGHGVFVSTDHGVSWTSFNKGMPPPPSNQRSGCHRNIYFRCHGRVWDIPFCKWRYNLGQGQYNKFRFLQPCND